MENYEASIQLYLMIFKICGILAIIMLIVSIVLFVVLKIPQVYGDLSGRYAQRAIQQMEEVNAQTGKLVSSKGLFGSKKSNKKNENQNLESSVDNSLVESYRTEKMQNDITVKTGFENKTGYSNTADLNETTSLDNTANLNETTVLEGETGVLNENNTSVLQKQEELNTRFIVERTIFLIHTQETI